MPTLWSVVFGTLALIATGSKPEVDRAERLEADRLIPLERALPAQDGPPRPDCRPSARRRSGPIDERILRVFSSNQPAAEMCNGEPIDRSVGEIRRAAQKCDHGSGHVV